MFSRRASVLATGDFAVLFLSMPNYLITGANRGLGLEFVRQLLARGDSITACCREPARAAELDALAVQAGDRLSVVALDVMDSNAISALPDQLKSNGAKLDVVINNAGVAAGHEDFGKFEEETMLRVLHINSVAPMLLTQALTPMLEGSASGGAKVVCITSILGSITRANNLSFGLTYGMSKAALNMGVKKLSTEMKRRGIAIVALHPGWVQTDMGGKGADLKPEQSIGGMLAVIDKLTVADNGRYLTYSGEELPW